MLLRQPKPVGAPGGGLTAGSQQEREVAGWRLGGDWLAHLGSRRLVRPALPAGSGPGWLAFGPGMGPTLLVRRAVEGDRPARGLGGQPALQLWQSGGDRRVPGRGDGVQLDLHLLGAERDGDPDLAERLGLQLEAHTPGPVRALEGAPELDGELTGDRPRQRLRRHLPAGGRWRRGARRSGPEGGGCRRAGGEGLSSVLAPRPRAGDHRLRRTDPGGSRRPASAAGGRRLDHNGGKRPPTLVRDDPCRCGQPAAGKSQARRVGKWQPDRRGRPAGKGPRGRGRPGGKR